MTEILLTGTLSNQNHISRAFNKGLHISDAFRATKKTKYFQNNASKYNYYLIAGDVLVKD